MLDVFIELTDAGADVVLENGDLRADETLRTAALISLETDSRAPDAALVDRPELAGDRRGWWADLRTRPWGCLLWLLERAKATPATRESGRQYAADAFGWMLEDEIAADVAVEATLDNEGRLALEVELTRGTARQWSSAWDATGRTDLTLEGVDVVLSFS